MNSSAVELALHCPHCGGAVTLQLVDWPDLSLDECEESYAQDSTWTCPYCSRPETIRLRGRLAWVTRSPTHGGESDVVN